MTKTMILGGNGCGLTKVLSRDFPGGATKCNEIIQFAVRIKYRYLPNENVEGYNYAIPFFTVLFIAFRTWKKHRYAALKNYINKAECMSKRHHKYGNVS